MTEQSARYIINPHKTRQKPHPCRKELVEVFAVWRKPLRYISEKPEKEGERIAELVLVVMAPLRSDSDSLRQPHYETGSVLRKSAEH